MKAELSPSELLPLSKKYPTPAFWFSSKRIRENYRKFTAGLPGVKIFFAIKSNSNDKILKILKEEGSCFDAASLGEIRKLRKLGITPDRIIYTTPVKPFDEIRAAFKLGVVVFVADSSLEIEKISKAAPGSKVLLRIQTSNKGSQWPLSRRFGADVKHALSLLQDIADRKLTVLGLSFHVGSQCVNVQNWRQAIAHAAKITKSFKQQSGIGLRVLDLGGGFPVCYTEPVPSLDKVFATIREDIKKLFGHAGIEIWAEPGRAIVADAAFAVTTIIGRARRGRNNWLFCDLGVFNGLLELIEPSSKGFRYELYTTPNGYGAKHPTNGYRKKIFTLTGPSCDGDDILMDNVELPDVGVGDRIYFTKTGAYSLVYASPTFCGNKPASIHIV